ncbi:MAG: hypothetical protein P8Y66_01225 [Nitrospirota bacterium]|jgi:hypothetical protein
MAVKFFGQFLLDRGVIGSEQLQEAVRHQEAGNLRFGEVARSKGMLGARELESLLREQRRTDMMIGEIAVKLGILSPVEVGGVLSHQKSEHLSLGEALVRKGFLSRGRLREELLLFEAQCSGQGDLVLPRGLSNPAAVRDALEVTAASLRRSAVTSVKPDEAEVTQEEPEKNFGVFSVRFNGDVNLLYVISVPVDVALLLVRGSRELPALLEAVRQFCAQASRKLASRLSEEGAKVRASQPKEVAWRDGGYSVLRGAKAVRFRLACPSGDSFLYVL